MIDIITSFYLPQDLERRNGITKTLQINIRSKFISNIHLFVDTTDCVSYLEDNFDDKENKIVICCVGKQPEYSDLFSYANTLSNRVCMICNSDIYILSIKKIELIKHIDNNRNVIFAITRHEFDYSSPQIRSFIGSHDAFIFKSPINTDLLNHIHFKQNLWGSENVVIFELNKLGYNLYNPCKDIVIIHLHVNENRDPNRMRINKGGVDGDGVYKRRSGLVFPSSPFDYFYKRLVREYKASIPKYFRKISSKVMFSRHKNY